MQKVGTAIFAAVSALALTFIIYTSRPFDNGIELPEIDIGKPFTNWPGVIVRITRDGSISVNGKQIKHESADKEISEAAKAREHQFKKLSMVAESEWPDFRLHMTPWLLCIDREASIYDCFPVLTTFWSGCPNISYAVQYQGRRHSTSFCSYICTWGLEPFHAYWKGKPITIEGEVRGIKVWTSKKGDFLFKADSGTWKTLERFGFHSIGENNEPHKHESIEYLFELIDKYRNEDIVIEFVLENYAKNLSWEWLANLLVRLENTPVKGYFFNTSNPY